ncbi:MAG: hypothetical protein RMY34_34365 [Aulosira sp. DedQUE10]|nr:hypothetical protein [Aulosira sp. DedQUE10]
MATVNQVSFKSICNQKVTVEELIDGELKGIVGGVVSSYTSNVTATSTDGTNSSVVDSTQEIVSRKKNERIRITKKTITINGLVQTTESQQTSPI